MKRILSIVLAAVLSASLLCSCSEKKPETKETPEKSTTEVIAENPADKIDAAEKEKIGKVFTDTLNNNKYEKDGKELPKYSIYDFDKDGIPELLIWAKQGKDSADRKIDVYKYNSSTGKAEKIGAMTDSDNHAAFGEAQSGDGIVIANGEGEKSKITKYTLKDGKIAGEVIAEKGKKTDEEWFIEYDPSQYMNSYEFPFSSEIGLLQSFFGAAK